jgi:AbrB family looped-hinge helix DNA binding protein
MVREAKVTSKGQVTIPLDIRKKLGVREGDKLVFDADGDAVTVRVAAPRESVFEKWRGIGTPGIGKGRAAILRWTREMRGR